MTFHVAGWPGSHAGAFRTERLRLSTMQLRHICDTQPQEALHH